MTSSREEGEDGSLSRGYKSREVVLTRFLETSLQLYRVVFARDIFEYLHDGVSRDKRGEVKRDCIQKALELLEGNDSSQELLRLLHTYLGEIRS